MILSPSAGLALSSMSDAEMQDTTAQAGFILSADEQIGIAMNAETISYGDDDGTNGTAGYLSLNNVEIQGGITMTNPTKIEMTTEMDPYTQTEKTGLNIELNGLVVQMDKMRIGSITVGSAPGEGKSFGSFEMTGFRAEISGKLRITTH
jgi:hypothetical protein